MIERLIFQLFLGICIQNGVLGCGLPSDWEAQWWSNYSSNSFTTNKFSVDSEYIIKYSSVTVTEDFQCTGFVEESPRYYYVRQEAGILVRPNVYCVYVYHEPGSDVMLQKVLALVPPETEPRECKNFTSSSTNYGDTKALLKYPIQNMNPKPNCLPPGKYMMEVETDAGAFCIGDKYSTANATSSTIITNSCISENSYNAPLKGSQLTCLAKFPSDAAGTTTTNGDIVIFRYASSPLAITTSPENIYYCARITSDGDLIYMSLGRSWFGGIYCPDDVDYKAVGVRGESEYTLIALKRMTCALTPCENGAVCNDMPGGGVSCACQPGYYGEFCENGPGSGTATPPTALPPLGCSSRPCFNQASCIEIPGGLFSCNCMPGFTGILCESRTLTPPPGQDNCLNVQCRNGGICFSRPNGFLCSCPEGYMGTYCEINVCESNPCINMGTCIANRDVVEGYLCLCPPDYGGPRCEYEGCQSRPCYNGAQCIPLDEDKNYECKCEDDYEGRHCEIPKNPDGKQFAPFTVAELITVIVIVAVVILILIFLIACYWRRRENKRAKRKAQQTPTTPVTTEQIFVKSPDVQVIHVDNPQPPAQQTVYVSANALVPQTQSVTTLVPQRQTATIREIPQTTASIPQTTASKIMPTMKGCPPQMKKKIVTVKQNPGNQRQQLNITPATVRHQLNVQPITVKAQPVVQQQQSEPIYVKISSNGVQQGAVNPIYVSSTNVKPGTVIYHNPTDQVVMMPNQQLAIEQPQNTAESENSRAVITLNNTRANGTVIRRNNSKKIKRLSNGKRVRVYNNGSFESDQEMQRSNKPTKVTIYKYVDEDSLLVEDDDSEESTSSDESSEPERNVIFNNKATRYIYEPQDGQEEDLNDTAQTVTRIVTSNGAPTTVYQYPQAHMQGFRAPAPRFAVPQQRPGYTPTYNYARYVPQNYANIYGTVVVRNPYV